MKQKIEGYILEINCRKCGKPLEEQTRINFFIKDSAEFQTLLGYVHFRCPCGCINAVWGANLENPKT